MRYPVKLEEKAGGLHKTLKPPESSCSRSAMRSVGWSTAVHRMIMHVMTRQTALLHLLQVIHAEKVEAEN